MLVAHREAGLGGALRHPLPVDNHLEGKRNAIKIKLLSNVLLQGWVNKWAPGWLNFVPAFATSFASTRLKNSRNLGPHFKPALYVAVLLINYAPFWR